MAVAHDLADEKVHYVLGEIIQGGLVLETNINEISACGTFPVLLCRDTHR